MFSAGNNIYKKTRNHKPETTNQGELSNFENYSKSLSQIETFEERPILAKYKEGDYFNHRNTFSISRIEI